MIIFLFKTRIGVLILPLSTIISGLKRRRKKEKVKDEETITSENKKEDKSEEKTKT